MLSHGKIQLKHYKNVTAATTESSSRDIHHLLNILRNTSNMKIRHIFLIFPLPSSMSIHQGRGEWEVPGTRA